MIAIISILLIFYLNVKFIKLQILFENWLMERKFNKIIKNLEKYRNDFIAKYESEIVLNKLLNEQTYIGDFVIYQKDFPYTFILQEFEFQCILLENFYKEIKNKGINFNSSCEFSWFNKNIFLNRNKEVIVLHLYT